ncbi:unnamed protein product, partial [Mesorhabditis belari]|uniref:Uncharacterized protein n=1 Tax=Mesorhabditis belari TaxID=2138241 RepID=A0AAF3J6N7_9BILA
MGCGASVEDSSVSASPTPNHSNDRHNRLSVVSLGLPGQDEDAMSASSVPSMEPPPTMPSTGFGGEEEKICNTELRIKWIVRKLTEHFPIHEEPQWIAERLNRKTSTEIESSTVIRITLAWESEDPRLPRSVVLKIPLAKEAREDEKGRFYYTLFKRECNAFDWLQHVKDFSTPIIYHIKKHGNEDGGGCIIMEDLGERAQQQDEKNGLGVLQSGNASITSEQVRAAYEKFVPVATVSFVHKVMVLRGKSEPDALIERANSLINQVYNTVRINEELIDDDKMNNNNWTS